MIHGAFQKHANLNLGSREIGCCEESIESLLLQSRGGIHVTDILKLFCFSIIPKFSQTFSSTLVFFDALNFISFSFPVQQLECHPKNLLSLASFWVSLSREWHYSLRSSPLLPLDVSFLLLLQVVLPCHCHYVSIRLHPVRVCVSEKKFCFFTMNHSFYAIQFPCCYYKSVSEPTLLLAFAAA